MKKFRCTVCGYVYEGDAAPEKCPLCKAPASKFVEVEEAQAGGPLVFADEHVIGVAKGCDDEMIKDLNNHFMGECTEVGMYLAMSRQADREGYPEVAEAFKRYAWEEAEHAAKFAELLGDCTPQRSPALPEIPRTITEIHGSRSAPSQPKRSPQEFSISKSLSTHFRMLSLL